MFNIKFREDKIDKKQGGKVVSYKKDEVKVMKKERKSYGLLTEKVSTYENRIENSINYNEAVQDIANSIG